MDAALHDATSKGPFIKLMNCAGVQGKMGGQPPKYNLYHSISHGEYREKCRTNGELKEVFKNNLSDSMTVDYETMIVNQLAISSLETGMEEIENDLTKYGIMRLRYLHEHKREMYRELLLTGKLAQHCRAIEQDRF